MSNDIRELVEGLAEVSKIIREPTKDEQIATLHRALEKACDWIDEASSCPMDMYDWEWKGGCEKVCETLDPDDGDVKKCWMQYFMEV